MKIYFHLITKKLVKFSMLHPLTWIISHLCCFALSRCFGSYFLTTMALKILTMGTFCWVLSSAAVSARQHFEQDARTKLPNSRQVMCAQFGAFMGNTLLMFPTQSNPSVNTATTPFLSLFCLGQSFKPTAS